MLQSEWRCEQRVISLKQTQISKLSQLGLSMLLADQQQRWTHHQQQRWKRDIVVNWVRELHQLFHPPWMNDHPHISFLRWIDWERGFYWIPAQFPHQVTPDTILATEMSQPLWSTLTLDTQTCWQKHHFRRKMTQANNCPWWECWWLGVEKLGFSLSGLKLQTENTQSQLLDSWLGKFSMEDEKQQNTSVSRNIASHQHHLAPPQIRKGGGGDTPPPGHIPHRNTHTGDPPPAQEHLTPTWQDCLHTLATLASDPYCCYEILLQFLQEDIYAIHPPTFYCHN